MYYETLTQPKRTFSVKLYDQFSGHSREDLKKYLGTIIHKKQFKVEQVFNGDLSTIPSAWNWINNTPATFGGVCVGAVRSQLNCGSCWTFASTSTLADRACVQSDNQNFFKGIVLAPQQLVLCDKLDECDGCTGGTLRGAWEFFEQHGVVNDVCMP